jgi:hypothetical protein
MQTIKDPNKDREIEPAVTSIGFDYNDEVAIRKEPQLKGSFAQMSKRVIKLTSYEERDGAVRTIS